MSNQLDLSKFPKILPYSEELEHQEIDKRSKALSGVKDAVENVINLLNAYVSELSAFDDKIKFLSIKEADLREQEYAVTQKEREVYALEEQLKVEKEYIIKAKDSLEGRERDLLVNKEILSKIEEAKQEYEQKKIDYLATQPKASDSVV